MSDDNTDHPDSLESKLMASVEKLQPESDTTQKPIAKEPEKDESAPKADDAPPDKDDEPKDTDDSKPDENAATETDDDTETLDPDFQKAAVKHDIPISLDDVLDQIPKEARAAAKTFIAQKLKGMDAGYTKAMQEAREYRKEKAQYDAEAEYRSKSPDQWLADYIQQNPSVIDKVNSELEKRNDPTYAEAHAKTRAADAKEAKLKADEAEIAERREAETERHIEERTEHVSNYLEASAKTHGIPVDLVEEAIAAAIMQSDEHDITDAEIDRIVTAKAKVFTKHIGAAKGAKTKEYAKAKAEDAKGTTLLPRSSSSGEAPTTPKKPANLEEAINAALDKMGAPA